MSKIKKTSKKVRNPYLDGSEQFLQKFFDKSELEKRTAIDSLLSDDTTPWAIRYHLSPQRHMLLNWYSFREKSSLLEIGAGCGAITGLFLEKLSSVTCNELSSSRSTVIRNRFQNYKNLTIYSGNINQFQSKAKYDYITLIGVLEYTAKYSSSSNPYKEILSIVKSLLKPNGHLLLSIENKIGLKYLAGAPEDHLSEIFTSLENYPQNKEIQTFTKSELTNLLTTVGFTKTDFYYPFPDYKLPTIVFSEEGLKSINNLTKSGITQTVVLSHEIDHLFNEIIFSHLLTKEKILQNFANSFLIDAS